MAPSVIWIRHESDFMIGSVIEMHPLGPRWYVHGHLPYDAAVSAIRERMKEEDGYCDMSDEEIDSMEFGPGWHRWYRWETSEEDIDYPYYFQKYSTKVENAFPATEVWEWYEWREHEEANAVEHWARMRTLRKFPSAQIVSITGRWPWDRKDDVVVRFKLPWTGRDVHSWKMGDRVVWLGTEDSWGSPACARLDRFMNR